MNETGRKGTRAATGKRLPAAFIGIAMLAKRCNAKGRAYRARLPLRLVLSFALTFGLLANWLPQWNAGRRERNVAWADNPATPSEFPIPSANSGSFQITGGPDGNFWFCESNTDNIGRATPAGVITEFQLPAGSSPYAITSGPDGNLWFTEAGTNNIGRITPTGTITHLPIPSPVSRPYGITSGSDGNIWFTEDNVDATKFGRVTPTGSFTEFPMLAGGDAPFLMAPEPDGNIWFTEQPGNAIGKITTSGVVTEYPIPTPNCVPSGITAGPDNTMWFTEYNANKLGNVSRFGVFKEYSIPTPNTFPFSITAAGDGYLYYTQQAANAIGQFSPTSLSFGSVIPTSQGPSGIATIPSISSDFNLGFVLADANRFGTYPLIATPPDCVVTLTQPLRSFDASGKKVCIAQGHSNCKPTAESSVDWIVVDDIGFVPERMECNVLYHVLPNTGTDPRFGDIKIGDKIFDVNQAGANPLPPVNNSPNTAPSGGPGLKLTVTPGGGSRAAITIEAAGFTGNSIVGWDGEDRPTTLVSPTELTADISADDLATPGAVQVTVFDPSPGGGTSPQVTFTITQGSDFALGLNQTTVNAQAGTKVRITVNLSRNGGFTGNVTITPPGPQAGIRPKPPAPVVLGPTDTSAAFKLKISGATPAGSYQLLFKGVDDSGRERDVTLTLIIQ